MSKPINIHYKIHVGGAQYKAEVTQDASKRVSVHKVWSDGKLLDSSQCVPHEALQSILKDAFARGMVVRQNAQAAGALAYSNDKAVLGGELFDTSAAMMRAQGEEVDGAG